MEAVRVAFTLDTKRKQRFEFMRCLYEKTEGSELGLVYVEEIAEQIQLSDVETEIISLYLADEGLIRVRMRNIISITHIGIDEVETALGHPDKPTAHFPPINGVPERLPEFSHSFTPPPVIPEMNRLPPAPAADPQPPEWSGSLARPMGQPDDLELTSICEAIGLDPGAIAGKASPHAAPGEPPARELEATEQVRKLLERAQASAASPAPVNPVPPPVSLSARPERTATARVLKPQATPAPRASEIADLLASLKLRLLKIRLDPDDMGEAQAEIATAIAQLLSPRPKQPIIAASLATLLSIFEDAHTTRLTNDVRKSLAKISDFLGQL